MNPTTPDFLNKSIWGMLAVLLLLLIYYLINIGNKYVSKDKRIEIDNKNVLIGIAILTFIYIINKTLKKYPFLKDLISTIFISILLAYAINPLINYLERKKISRSKGVLIVYLSLIIIIFILGSSVIPKSIKEIRKLGNNFPYYVNQITEFSDKLSNRIKLSTGEMPPAFKGIEDSFLKALKGFEEMIGNIFKSLATSVINLASKVVNIVLTPILTFYFLVDKEKFKNKLVDLIPKKYREDIIHLASTIDGSLVMFIRGRLIMALYIAVATTIMLLIMRVDFAIVIGFITGLFDIVPYVGPFIGYLPAVFFGALDKPIKAIWISIFFVLIQWIENNILAPKIIGDNMGLHPMTILLSLIVGGGIFGILGMVLAVPMVATIKIVYYFFKSKRKNKKAINKV